MAAVSWSRPGFIAKTLSCKCKSTSTLLTYKRQVCSDELLSTGTSGSSVARAEMIKS